MGLPTHYARAAVATRLRLDAQRFPRMKVPRRRVGPDYRLGARPHFMINERADVVEGDHE